MAKKNPYKEYVEVARNDDEPKTKGNWLVTPQQKAKVKRIAQQHFYGNESLAVRAILEGAEE